MNGDKKDIKTENDSLSSPEPINPLILNQELIAPASTSSIASNINIPLIEHKVQQFNVAQESKKRVPTYYENYDKNVQEVKQAEADEIKLGASNVVDSYYMNYSGGNRNEVSSIQEVLFNEGYYPKGSKRKTEVDGKFGPKTRKAYEKYVNQQLPNEAKDDWIDLSDVKKQLVCKEEGCAAFVTKTFEDHNVDVVDQGIITDAWTMNKTMKDRGGREKYNIYNKYDFSDVKSKEELKRRTKKIKAKDHTNADMFQVGDVVGMYYDGSEYHEKALNEGTGTHNTHVGVVTRIKNGVPIVSHNVDGIVKHDPWHKVETGWIVSPSQSKTGQFEYSIEVPQHDNSRIISNISAAKEEVGSRPFTEKQADSLNTNINYLKNDIPKLIKETQSVVDDDWLISTILAITGKETGFGVSKPSKNEDALAKTVKTIKGGKDYGKSIVQSSIDKGRLTKGREERDPASSLYYSQGITKIKPGYLDEFSKRYLDVNVKNINDDRKALAATSMKLIKAYDYFTKYKENNPQLNLTEEDIRNVSILTFNEDLSKWVKLGYRNPNMFPVEEIKALRDLYTGKVKDISSTKYSHIPDVLWPIKQMLYEGEFPFQEELGLKGFPEGHETYISRVNKYAESIREKAKGGKISTKGYLPNSPDKNKSSLIVPSQHITMKGVPHKVLGTDRETGEQRIMNPGEEHFFNGKKGVQEIPLQDGGQVTDAVPIGVPFTPEELINNFNIDPNEFERGNVEEHEEQNVEDLIANSNLSEEEEAAYRRAMQRKTALQARPGGFLQSADIKVERPYIPGSLESFAASFGMGKDQIEKSFWEKLEADAEQGVGLGNIVREYMGKEWIPGRIEENMREIEENYNILATKYKHQPIQISDAWMNPERFWAHEFPKIMGQAIPLVAFPLGGTAVGALGGALATGGPGAVPGAAAGAITTGALIGGLLGSGVGIFQEAMSEAGDVVERSYQMLKEKHKGDPAWPESRIKEEAYKLSEKSFSRQVAFLSATELPQIALNIIFPGSKVLTKTLAKLPEATARSVMKKAAKYPQAKSMAKWGGYLSGNIAFEAMQEGVQFVINEDVLNEVRDPEFQKSFYWSDLMDDTEFMDNVKSGGIMGLFLGGGFKMISEGMKNTVDELSKKTPKQVADSLRLKEVQTILTAIASGKSHILKGQILNAVDSGVMAEDSVTDKEQRIKDSKKVADEKIKLIEDYEAKWNVIDNNSTVNNAVDKVTGKKLTPIDKLEIKKQMFFNSLQLDFVSETLSDSATKATFQGEMNEAKGLLEQEKLVLEKWNGYLSQGVPNYQARIHVIADAVKEGIDMKVLNGTFVNAEEQFKIYKEVAEDFTKPKKPFWQSVANYFRKKEGKKELKEETKEELETQLQEALNKGDKEKAKNLEGRIEALEEKPLTEEELGKEKKEIGIDSSQEEIIDNWRAERKKAKEENAGVDPREQSMKDQISKDASIVPEARRKINKFISELIDRGFGHLEVVKLVNQKFKNSIAAPIKYIQTPTDAIDSKYERILKKKEEKKEAKPEAKEKKEEKEKTLEDTIKESLGITTKVSSPILFFFESAKEAKEQTTKSKNTKAEDAIGQRVIHIDDENEFTVGRIVEEEGIIIFRPDNDLGFALQLDNEDILFDNDLILVPEATEVEKEVEASEVEIGEEDNEYIIRGKTYKNLHSKPENAINRDDKGNIISVTLTDENGKNKTFRNSEIIDNIAYNIILSTTAIKEDITQTKKDEPVTKKPKPRKKPSREGPEVSKEQKPKRETKPGKPVFERTKDQQRISDKLDHIAEAIGTDEIAEEDLDIFKMIREATNSVLNEKDSQWLLDQEAFLDGYIDFWKFNKEKSKEGATAFASLSKRDKLVYLTIEYDEYKFAKERLELGVELTDEEFARAKKLFDLLTEEEKDIIGSGKASLEFWEKLNNDISDRIDQELTEKEQKIFDELELFAQQEGFVPKKERKTWVYVLQSMNRRRREKNKPEKPVTKKEFVKLTKKQISAAAGMSASARKIKAEAKAKKKVPGDIERKTRTPKDEDEEELTFTSQVLKEEEELKKEDDKVLETLKFKSQELREKEKVLEGRIADKLTKNARNNIVPEEDSDLMKDLADLIALYLQHAGVTVERIIYQLKKNLGTKAANFVDKNVVKVLEKSPEGKKLLEKEKLQKEQEEQEILDVEFDDERVGTTLGKLFSILNEIKDINKKASVRDLLLLSTQLRQQINQQKEELSYEEIVEIFKDSASFSKNTEKAVPLIASKFTPGEVVSLIAIASSHQVHPFFHFIGSNTGKWNVNLSNRAQEEKEDIDEAISIFNKTIQRREDIALSRLREANNKLSKKEKLTEYQLKDKIPSVMENMYRSFIISYLKDGITIEGKKYRGIVKISEEHKQESSESRKKELRKEAIETDLAWAKVLTGLDWTDYLNEYSNTYTGKYSNTYIHDFIEGNTNKVDIYSSLITKIGSYLFNVKTADYDKATMQYRKQSEPWKSFKARIKEGKSSQIVTLSREKQARRATAIFASAFQNVMNKRGEATILDTQISEDAANITKKPNKKYWNDNLWVQYFRDSKNPHPIRLNLLDGAKNISRLDSQERGKLSPQNFLIMQIVGFLQSDKFAKQASIPADYSKKVEGEYGFFIEQFGTSPQGIFASAPKWALTEARNQYKRISKDKLVPNQTEINELIDDLAKWITDVLRTTSIIEKNEIEDPHAFAEHFYYNFIVNKYYSDLYFQGKPEAFTKEGKFLYLESQVKRAQSRWSGGVVPLTNIKGGLKKKLNAIVVDDPKVVIELLGKTFAKDKELTDGLVFYRIKNIENEKVKPGLGEQAVISYGDIISKGAKSFPFMKLVYSQVRDNGMPFQLKSLWMGIDPALGKLSPMLQSILDYMNKWNIDVFALDSSAKLKDETILKGEKKDVMPLFNKRGIIKNLETSPKIIEMDTDYLFMQQDYRKNVTMQPGGVKEQGGAQAKRGTMTFPHEISKTLNNIYSTIVDRKSTQLMSEINNEQNIYDNLVKQQTEQGKKINEKKLRKEARKQANEEWRKKLYNKVGDEDHLFYAKSMLKEMLTHPHLLEQEQKAINWGMIDKMLEAEVYGQVYMATPDLGYIKAYNKEGKVFSIGPLKAARIARIVNGVEVEISNEEYKKIKDPKVKKQYKILPAQALVPRNSGLEMGEQFFMGRIPHDGFHNQSLAEVVGFLPASMENIIAVDPVTSFIAGEDYDGDFRYIWSQKKNKEGQIVKYNEKYKDQYTDDGPLINEAFLQTSYVYQNPEFYEALIDPIVPKQVDKFIEHIRIEDSKTSKYDFLEGMKKAYLSVKESGTMKGIIANNQAVFNYLASNRVGLRDQVIFPKIEYNKDSKKYEKVGEYTLQDFYVKDDTQELMNSLLGRNRQYSIIANENMDAIKLQNITPMGLSISTANVYSMLAMLGVEAKHIISFFNHETMKRYIMESKEEASVTEKVDKRAVLDKLITQTLTKEESELYEKELEAKKKGKPIPTRIKGKEEVENWELELAKGIIKDKDVINKNTVNFYRLFRHLEDISSNMRIVNEALSATEKTSENYAVLHSRESSLNKLQNYDRTKEDAYIDFSTIESPEITTSFLYPGLKGIEAQRAFYALRRPIGREIGQKILYGIEKEFQNHFSHLESYTLGKEKVTMLEEALNEIWLGEAIKGILKGSKVSMDKEENSRIVLERIAKLKKSNRYKNNKIIKNLTIRDGKVILKSTLAQDVEITPDQITELKEAFASLPKDLKLELVVYNFHEYGYKKTTFNGGFSFYVDNETNKNISEEMDSALEIFDDPGYAVPIYEHILVNNPKLVPSPLFFDENIKVFRAYSPIRNQTDRSFRHGIPNRMADYDNAQAFYLSGGYMPGYVRDHNTGNIFRRKEKDGRSYYDWSAPLPPTSVMRDVTKKTPPTPLTGKAPKTKIIVNKDGLIIKENAIDEQTSISIVNEVKPIIEETSYKQTKGSSSFDMGKRWTRTNTLKGEKMIRSIVPGKQLNGMMVTEKMIDEAVKTGRFTRQWPLYVYSSLDRNGKALPPIPTKIINILDEQGIDIGEYQASYNSVYDRKDKGSLVIHQDNTEQDATYPIITISLGRPMKFITYEISDPNEFNITDSKTTGYRIALNLVTKNLKRETRDQLKYGDITPGNIVEYAKQAEKDSRQDGIVLAVQDIMKQLFKIGAKKEHILKDGSILVFSNENRNVMHEIVFDEETDQLSMPQGFPTLSVNKAFSGLGHTDRFVKTNDYRVVLTLRRITPGKKGKSVVNTDKFTKTPPTASIGKAPTSMREITNHSGGAIGADSMWDEIGTEYGQINHIHYYHGRKTDKGNRPLTQEEVNEGIVEAKKAAKILGRPWNDEYASLLGRNWFQVKQSTQVVAIAPIVHPGEKNSKGYVVKAKRDTVDGGTGYAVEMAIANNKDVNVFNTKDNQWYKWNGTTFVKSVTPVLNENFAGIGSRKITEAGKQAIRHVYEKTEEVIMEKKGFIREEQGGSGKGAETKRGWKRRTPPKLMRGVDAIGEQLRSSNPELAKFIEEKFKKMFPGIDVRFITNWVDEEGMDILGAAIGNTLYINTDKAVQSTFFHENSHLYYDAMPSDNPIKKKLNQMFETEEDAILAIGRAGVELADEDLYLLGGITKYFTPKAFKILLKRFWRWIKRGFNISNKDDVARMMASEVWENKAQLTSEDFISEQMKFMISSYYLTDENVIANQEKSVKALKEIGFSWEDDVKLGKAAIVMSRNIKSDQEISLEAIERTEFTSSELEQLESIGIRNPTLEVLTFGHLVLKQYKGAGGFETITVREPRKSVPELEEINEEIKRNIEEYNYINRLSDIDVKRLKFPMDERFDMIREKEEVKGLTSKHKREIWLSTIKDDIKELQDKAREIEERHPGATYKVPALIRVNPRDPSASIEVQAKPGDKMTPAPKTIQSYFTESKSINKEQYAPGTTLNLGIPHLEGLSEEEQSKRLLQWTEDDLEQSIPTAAKKYGIKALIQEYQKYAKDFKELYEMFNNTFPSYVELFNTPLSRLDEVLYKIKINRDVQAQVGFLDVVQSVYSMKKFKEFIKNPEMDAFGTGYKLWAEAFYEMYGLGPMERGKGKDLKMSWLGRWGTSPKDYTDKVMQLKNYIINMTQQFAMRESNEISREMSAIENKVLKEGHSIEETLYTYDKEGEKRLRDIYWKENKRPNDLRGLSKNQEDYLRLYVNSLMRNMPEGAYRLETVGDQARSNYDNNILYKKPIVEADFFELLKEHGLYKAIELKTFGKNRLGYILIHAEGYEEPITLESAREDILESIHKGKLKKKAGEKLWKEYQDQATHLFERGMDANYNSLYNVTNQTVPLSGIDFMSEDKIVEEAISKNASATIKKYIRELSYKNHMEKVLPLAHFFDKFYEGNTNTNVRKLLETYNNERFFKQSPQSAFPKYEKAIRFMTGWTALRFLALNYLAPIFNISAGQSQNFIDMEPKIWARGIARLARNPIKAYKIMKNMEIVNTSIDAELSIPKENIRKIQRVLFLGIEAAENLNQGVMFLGMMGDKFDHYNANGVVKKGKQGLTVNEQYYITSQIQRSHGPYHPLFRRQMNLTAEGQAMIQFKGWMPEMFQRYFLNSFVDEHGKVRKGMLHTLWEEESRTSILEYLSGKRKWESLAQVDRYNLARGLRTLIMLSLFALWISLLDEDDENKEVADKLRRALGDVTYVFDIDNLQFLIAAPVPMLSTITDTLGAFGELIEGSKYSRDSKYGKEGQYKWIPSLVKATVPFRRPSMALYESIIVD